MAKAEKRWSTVELIDWTTNYMVEKGFLDAHLQVELMLAHVLQWKRIDLYLHFDRPLSRDELAQFKGFLKRRLDHEPLQYILGEQEFYSLIFKVNPAVLIPRPETEILVEKALAWAEKNYDSNQPIKILDLCTGSGCIAIVLAKHLPSAQVTAIDISPEALNTAQENAKLNDVAEQIEFVEWDLFSAPPFEKKFDLIVTNPPYIKAGQYEQLEKQVLEFEPKEALLAQEEGLAFYKRFKALLPELVNSNFQMFAEIDIEMGKSLKSLYEKHYSSVNIIKDLTGRDRVIALRG